MSIRALRLEKNTYFVHYAQFDEGINAIVASWPAAIDNSTALKAGFRVDSDFQSVIRQFIEKDLRK